VNTVIVGIGNPWRGDDGAGLVVAERVHERLPAAHVVQIVDEPTRLLESFGGADTVLVVDAVSTQEPQPGSIHRIDAIAHELPVGFGSSTHHFGLADTVELARSLGKLPPRLVVYGIEGSRFDTGPGLGPEVERAAAAVIDEIVHALDAGEA
jgi:hydrogenase maturation protease